MLFTTATFAFLFLPAALAGYFLLGRWSARAAAAWLLAASLFFYGYWMPEFTLLLLASIGANFAFGMRIAAARANGGPAGAWLAAGVGFDLMLLAYFKYAGFFVDNVNALLGTTWSLGEIVLPIGISFYTFTQIAYLVDSWAGKVREVRPIHYGLFVTYFPHLVAGPVLHHAQMMPQFAHAAVYRFQGANFSAGLAIFAIGLFKKVVLADGVAPYADAVFAPVDAGLAPGAAEAWTGALAYTFQLYFDFSGYSDMAVGLSWMFNIRLPFNFDSPYKATSISDFWRRWHISLSTFLRDYLYFSLGGNRKGAARRYANLGITMVLGGLWHGASWSFVLWGALHGAYLMLNHGFRAWTARLGWRRALDRSRAFAVLAWASTFGVTVVAWVFFRAETLPGALRMLQGMAGFAPPGTDAGLLLWNAGLQQPVAWGWCLVLGAAAVALPNSNALGERLRSALQRGAFWRGVVGASALLGAVGLVVLNTARDSVSAFIYFNF
ncbi:MAG: MBOAT family protein [Burkholderiales bacterium]|nr:MBOAT family protein [Burkholderiales bacterium]